MNAFRGHDGLADGSSQSSESGKAESVELTASLKDDNSTDTRVGMSKNEDKASFYWHKDEAILVQTVNGDTYPGVKFTTSEETGATTATFNGTISEGSLGSYAVYPYNENHKFTSATALTYYLPATYTYKEPKKEDGKYTINNHTFVDLGLPSGLLWAETNIGAESATDYGNYYAWGETTTKDSYSKPSSYTENPSTLDAVHDAATVNWGAPTKEEFDELLSDDKK